MSIDGSKGKAVGVGDQPMQGAIRDMENEMARKRMGGRAQGGHRMQRARIAGVIGGIEGGGAKANGDILRGA